VSYLDLAKSAMKALKGGPEQEACLLSPDKVCGENILGEIPPGYCPRCGGVVFIPDPQGQNLCAACDWNLLTELYPGLREKRPYDRTELRKTA
jgi:hypothetical protein